MKHIALFIIVLIPFFSIAQKAKTKQGLDIAAFEAKLKQSGDHAQLLDARSKEEYQQNHLKGAVHLSGTSDDEIQQQFNRLDKSKPVFVYSIGNGRSGKLAEKLSSQGFKEVYELPGGISQWIGTKRPVESTVGQGLTAADYKALLKTDKQTVLVDVSSRYCGACKKLAPIVDSISKENSSSLKVVKIEFFDNKQLAQELEVTSIPALLLYKDGKIVWQKTGITPKTEIQAEIEKAISIN